MTVNKLSDAEFNKLAQRPQRTFEIFVDMDGVLSDFDLHARERGKFKLDGSPKWDELDFAWWESMPAFPGARKFYDALKRIGNVRILTAPIISVDCFGGKAAWVEKFFPEKGHYALLDLIICRASDKKFLARPNHILIDDRIKNVEEWVAAGGIGIHHKGDFADTIKRTQEAMEKYRQQKPDAGKPLDPPAPQ